MTSKFAVVVFPGSNCDKDCVRALRDVMGQDVSEVWHTETTLSGFEAVVLPGGFSYGDYLRCGALARFSKIMRAVKEHADRGGLVLGICNGFQILVEAHLLPGALIRNKSLKFMCKPVWVKRERSDSIFTSHGEDFLRLPIAHGEGRYSIDEEGRRRLEGEGRIAFRYEAPVGEAHVENPNGSAGRIAGVMNERGNILGMMPHPERACEEFTGGVTHGRWIFESMIAHLQGTSATSVRAVA